MKIEEHKKAFEEHKKTIFRWAVEVLGLDEAQRTIGLHASRGMVELLSILIHKTGKVDSGFQLNHRWFKSENVAEKLPEFSGKNKIIPEMVKLENLSEILTYGSDKPRKIMEETIKLFRQLEEMIKTEIGDEYEKK